MCNNWTTFKMIPLKNRGQHIIRKLGGVLPDCKNKGNALCVPSSPVPFPCAIDELAIGHSGKNPAGPSNQWVGGPGWAGAGRGGPAGKHVDFRYLGNVIHTHL